MLAQDSGNEEAKAFHRVGHRGHRIGTRLASAAKQVAEKCSFRPSGVKTPEENAAFMSCLKARPTKLKTFSATCKACATRPRRNARIRIRRKIPLLSVAGFVEAARCLGGQFLSGTYLLGGYLIPGRTADPSA